MPRMTAAKAMIETLAVNGVDTVFGVLGSTLFEAYNELFEHPQIRLITPRGEDFTHDRRKRRPPDPVVRCFDRVEVNVKRDQQREVLVNVLVLEIER